MSLRVAIQMDPFVSINPRTDSTLLLAQEAKKRGHALWHYIPSKLSWHHGKITARGNKLTFKGVTHGLGKEETLDLAQMDVVLLRQDPPFDMGYLSTTYILERLAPKTLVVNNPKSVRDCPEKLFPTLFRKYMPETLVTADPIEIEHFRKIHKDIVIKPLYGHGGRSVLRLTKDDGNFSALMEMLFTANAVPWMVQPFLPQVKDQERRIVMMGGEFSGIVGRIPAAGDIRANFRVGGTAAKVKPTKKQMEICDALGPSLKEYGLVFVGLDVIGDYLTEVNVTSPTGLVPINALYNKKLESEFWDCVEGML